MRRSLGHLVWLALLSLEISITTGCRWNDLGATGRAVPVLPHDKRSLGSPRTAPGTAGIPGSVRLDPSGCESPADHDAGDWRATAPELGEILTLDEVLEIVRKNNPSLDSAEATWMAARENYPQVTSLPDPQVRFLNGPTIFGDSSGAHLWRLQAQQKLPWFGKRTLMGEIADQKANVAKSQWDAAQAALAELAVTAFYDYAEAEQIHQFAQQLHELDAADLAAARGNGVTPAATFTGHEQELHEISWLEQERRAAEIREGRMQAQRRLNRLLHRPASARLPVVWLPDLGHDSPDEDQLIEAALRQRPELAALRAKVRESEYQLDLSYKNFYPDPELVARFDTQADQFWSPDRANIRPQLGFNMLLPVRHERLMAAVRQSEWEIRSHRTALIATEHKIRGEIQDAHAQWKFVNSQLDVNERLVQLAEQRVHSLKAYVVHDDSQQDRLVAAQRKLIACQLERTKAEFAVHRQLARLHALAGNSIASATDAATP